MRQMACSKCGKLIWRADGGSTDPLCWRCKEQNQYGYGRCPECGQNLPEPWLDLDALGEPGPISPPLPDADQLAAGMAQSEASGYHCRSCGGWYLTGQAMADGTRECWACVGTI